MSDEKSSQKLTFWQRLGMREIRREAGKGPDEPLGPEDWAAAYRADSRLVPRTVHRLWKALPSSPRCARCGAPFAGVGRFIVRPLGYSPSRKNPTICATCVETSPPGGMKMQAGVLFADLRGFTARSEGADPEEVSLILRLQGEAAGGEIVISERAPAGLSEPAGTRVELTLKGKSESQVAYRVTT